MLVKKSRRLILIRSQATAEEDGHGEEPTMNSPPKARSVNIIEGGIGVRHGGGSFLRHCCTETGKGSVAPSFHLLSRSTPPTFLPVLPPQALPFFNIRLTWCDVRIQLGFLRRRNPSSQPAVHSLTKACC